MRSASGVTSTIERAVGTSTDAEPEWKSAPISAIPLVKIPPKSSGETLPMKATSPPRLAIPAIVFAPEPPLVWTAPGSDEVSSSALSVSMSAIEPFVMPWLPRNSSGTIAITSTIALPMPTTS